MKPIFIEMASNGHYTIGGASGDYIIGSKNSEKIDINFFWEIPISNETKKHASGNIIDNFTQRVNIRNIWPRYSLIGNIIKYPQRIRVEMKGEKFVQGVNWSKELFPLGVWMYLKSALGGLESTKNGSLRWSKLAKKRSSSINHLRVSKEYFATESIFTIEIIGYYENSSLSPTSKWNCINIWKTDTVS